MCYFLYDFPGIALLLPGDFVIVFVDFVAHFVDFERENWNFGVDFVLFLFMFLFPTYCPIQYLNIDLIHPLT